MSVPVRPLVLASASPARLALLRAAGFDPQVVVSGVDESTPAGQGTREQVLDLAVRKARTVAAAAGTDGALVLGCDSMLELAGRAYGKPGTAQVALERWRQLRGRQGTLLTGHCVVDMTTGGQAADVAATVVRFGTPTDDELAAYVATGEPLAVAGGFTLDGRSAPFINGIDGDPGNVIGLSLPLLRVLLGRLGVSVTELWSPCR